jgi:peptide-methionine (S)-S-oxide reductase
MKRWIWALALLGMVLPVGAQAQIPGGLKQATFAGGCFWCTEAIFEELEGVKGVTAGMMGGKDEGLTPEQVAKGEGGHAEVIFLLYDPNVISYTTLLEVFFATHDPTSLNKQGADEGVEYRSAVFTFDDTQKALAEGAIAELTKEGIYDKPIVTEVTPATKFYAAAEKHQDYYAKKSDAQYCELIITPKVEKFRKIFADKLKKDSKSN